MKIQEMRSGSLHLAKRREGDESEIPSVMRAADVAILPDHVETACELDEPRWAVVSFERCEAAGLTYEHAANVLADLAGRGVSGLCVVTDAVASRIRS